MSVSLRAFSTLNREDNVDRLQMDAYQEGFKVGKDARNVAATRALTAERALSDALASALRDVASKHYPTAAGMTRSKARKILDTYDAARSGK